jgi:hypothetical protein
MEDLFHFPGDRFSERAMLPRLEVYPVEVARVDDTLGVQEMAPARPGDL